MRLGLAITEHCNLRCPHCIRDDVTTVRSLETELIASIVDQAKALYGSVVVSLTGGEPLLHPEFARIADIFVERAVPYRFVSNGWHVNRIARIVRRCAPQAVRLSLSGATPETHDAERGDGSFHRVLRSLAVLTSEQIPCDLSMVIDRRNRHELEVAADLAESLGCLSISFILPQPTPGSAERDSDLPPDAWLPTKRALENLAQEPGRQSRVRIDYGYPFDGPETPCETFALQRIYVDTRGRVCTCCQLSNYGFTETETVADLHTTSLAEAHDLYVTRLEALRQAQQPDSAAPHLSDPFPCIRCARASGKLGWLADFPQSAWHGAARQPTKVTPAA
jgi:MoaA/NifB/PqqE/SkfB family radical SAM enzyme